MLSNRTRIGSYFARDPKKQGYDIELNPVELRLIKYKIDDETYVCCTTLLGEQYPLNDFPAVYHGRWGIEELYKISKEFVDVEDFHGKSERGVKQECYAHMLLINLARIFEVSGERQYSYRSSIVPWCSSWSRRRPRTAVNMLTKSVA